MVQSPQATDRTQVRGFMAGGQGLAEGGNPAEMVRNLSDN